MNQVTDVLRTLDANIETFATRIEPAPHSGASLFHMDAQLRLPVGVPMTELQRALEAVSGEVMVDIALALAVTRPV